MADTDIYPFQLKDVILISLHAGRQAVIPDVVSVNVAAGVRIVDDQYPRLEIGLKMRTQGEPKHITFDLELVGIFELAEGAAEPDRAIGTEFASNRALFILWAYADQTVRQLTSQMGVNPIKLLPPHQFTIKLSEPMPDQTSGI
jgi:preprotein translocase subunit SecB